MFSIKIVKKSTVSNGGNFLAICAGLFRLFAYRKNLASDQVLGITHRLIVNDRALEI